MKLKSKYVLPYKENSPYTWVRYIHKRIADNKNFICITVGSTGSGKSWCNLSIAEMLDPNFNIDNIVFGGLELMRLIASGKLKKGSVIVFEEVGVNASSANWQSQTNKALNFLFQTFRSKNFILLMNLPKSKLADSRNRILTHAKFKTLSIDKKAQQTIIKPLAQEYNEDRDKTYYHRLSLKLPSGKYRKVDKWGVPKPSKELLEQYEIKKEQFNDNLVQSLIKVFEQEESGTVKNLTAQQEKVLDLLENDKTTDEIADIMQISRGGAEFHMTALRKKGYKIQAVKENARIIKYNVEDLRK